MPYSDEDAYHQPELSWDHMWEEEELAEEQYQQLLNRSAIHGDNT